MSQSSRQLITPRIVVRTYLLVSALIILAGLYTSVQLHEISGVTQTAAQESSSALLDPDSVAPIFIKLENPVTADNAQYDINGDGTVTVDDLNMLLIAHNTAASWDEKP